MAEQGKPGTIRALSKKGGDKSYLWVLLDHDGELHAVAHGEKSVSQLLSKGGLSLALIKSRDAFLKMGKTPTLTGQLVSPHTGKAL
jgi:hypothetical protein